MADCLQMSTGRQVKERRITPLAFALFQGGLDQKDCDLIEKVAIANESATSLLKPYTKLLKYLGN